MVMTSMGYVPRRLWSEEAPFPVSPIPAANVASVPQRSPLRYPGGKTWLIPHIRTWLGSLSRPPRLLVEPFCGGAVVSLTAAAEGLAEHCLMAELDRDVAAFWHAALRHGPELSRRIAEFEPSRAAVAALDHTHNGHDVVSLGFRTFVLNRTRRGGILAPGASLTRSGENGKGIASRWYPKTLISRLEAIQGYTQRITFCETDGMQLLEATASGDNTAVFADPPYTAGGKRAGSRLYKNSEIDHARLFKILADSGAEFLMTYDAAPEIVDLIRSHRFHALKVTMKNTHHARIPELVITNRPVFDEPPGHLEVSDFQLNGG